MWRLSGPSVITGFLKTGGGGRRRGTRAGGRDEGLAWCPCLEGGGGRYARDAGASGSREGPGNRFSCRTSRRSQPWQGRDCSPLRSLWGPLPPLSADSTHGLGQALSRAEHILLAGLHPASATCWHSELLGRGRRGMCLFTGAAGQQWLAPNVCRCLRTDSPERPSSYRVPGPPPSPFRLFRGPSRGG
ncbi:Hypothetical predicted protein [Lynx pardinus]|uniref:Uncharacterized protein n=1 Tax=Lynx pardinus TaxID=191816 RepID=A0A485N4Q9_LYNPA|nr:Hypothetical predicted protein [Lynx pardinus]